MVHTHETVEDKTLDIEELDAHIEEAWLIRRVDHDASEKQAKDYLEASKTLNYSLGIAKCQLIIAMQMSYRNEYEEAEAIFKDIMPIFVQENDILHQSRVENSIAYTYLNRGDFEKALNHLLKALPLAKSVQDNEAVSMILFNIAEIYLDPMLNEHEKALSYYLEAKAYGSDKPRAIYALILANIAVCYQALGDTMQALEYAAQALERTNSLTVDSSRSQIYHILGEFYYSLKKYEKAYEVMEKGISIHIDNEYPDLQIQDYILFSKIKIELNHEDIEAYIKIAMEKAIVFNAPKILGEVHLLYGGYLYKLKRYEEAANYYVKAIQYKDIYHTESLDLHLNALQAEYNHEQIKKDAEIYRLKNIELKEKSDALELALNELKETQVLLVQNEKMALLGNLISGIAHEINSPFGAIQGSVSNIQHVLNDTLTLHLPTLLINLDETARHAFFKVLEVTLTKDLLLTTREERVLRRQLEKHLKVFYETHQISDRPIDKQASLLVDMGIHELTDPLSHLLLNEHWDLIMNTCHALTGILRNVENIHISVDKASKVIQALKYYTHFNPEEVYEMTDLNIGIENVLQLFYNQFKGRVDVQLELNPLPPILCIVDLLNQVWMNLIQNALQAMDFKGILKITSRHIPSTENVQIIIEDNGKGIPEHLLHEIFKPFFTTKAQGEGSGLGLSFVQKTVDKHQGAIDVVSDPGYTKFTITLPIEPKIQS